MLAEGSISCSYEQVEMGRLRVLLLFRGMTFSLMSYTMTLSQINNKYCFLVLTSGLFIGYNVLQVGTRVAQAASAQNGICTALW